jgi:GAF domain-containing protein
MPAPPAPVAGQPLLVDVREGEQQILELILDGASLNHVLTRVAKAVEAQGPEIVCSILLIGPDGSRLRYGVAPSLPESYRAATDCLSIGPNAGSCGTAAYRREPVFVADILSDRLWESLRDATASLGLRACWSTPIMSHGRLLGTFAIYFRTVRLPDPTERRLIDVAGRFAAIAIERQQSTENLRRSQAYLAEAERLTHVGSWAYDAVRRVPIYWCRRAVPDLGIRPDRRCAAGG